MTPTLLSGDESETMAASDIEHFTEYCTKHIHFEWLIE